MLVHHGADPVDLGFRPRGYFRPQRLERFLASKVKTGVVRSRLLAMLDAGRFDEVAELLTAEGVSHEVLAALERFHPMFMGGNYLPDPEPGEVEIARIRIASTTSDVTAVYARRDDGGIRYRVVDEYEGETLQDATPAWTAKPMTLRELTDFFLGAWPLFDVLEMNFEGALEPSLEFFVAESAFYPELDRLCRQRVIDRFPASEEDDESDSDVEIEDADYDDPGADAETGDRAAAHADDGTSPVDGSDRG